MGDADEAGLATRLARKLLLAVAALVSVHDGTWTTDRAFAASRWSEVEPRHADGLATLLDWTAGAPSVGRLDVAAVLGDVVDPLVDRFATDIGLWP